MKNWKTMVGGIIIAMPQIIALFGVAVPPPVGQIITAVGALWTGYFAKDMNVTGGTVSQ